MQFAANQPLEIDFFSVRLWGSILYKCSGLGGNDAVSRSKEVIDSLVSHFRTCSVSNATRYR